MNSIRKEKSFQNQDILIQQMKEAIIQDILESKESNKMISDRLMKKIPNQRI